MRLQIKRVYDSPAGIDGMRILVDRLWPRGLSKDECSTWERVFISFSRYGCNKPTPKGRINVIKGNKETRSIARTSG